MDKGHIERLISEGKLRRRMADIPRVKSLLESAKSTADVVSNMQVNEKTATLIFRELYESIRQIGDAKWWSDGYEPVASHEVSMEILMEMKIKEGVKLNKLDNFRRIRNNANYRGYKILIEQAKDIMDFWKSCASDLINSIENSINKK